MRANPREYFNLVRRRSHADARVEADGHAEARAGLSCASTRIRRRASAGRCSRSRRRRCIAPVAARLRGQGRQRSARRRRRGDAVFRFARSRAGHAAGRARVQAPFEVVGRRRSASTYAAFRSERCAVGDVRDAIAKHRDGRCRVRRFALASLRVELLRSRSSRLPRPARGPARGRDARPARRSLRDACRADPAGGAMAGCCAARRPQRSRCSAVADAAPARAAAAAGLVGAATTSIAALAAAHPARRRCATLEAISVGDRRRFSRSRARGASSVRLRRAGTADRDAGVRSDLRGRSSMEARATRSCHAPPSRCASGAPRSIATLGARQRELALASPECRNEWLAFGCISQAAGILLEDTAWPNVTVPAATRSSAAACRRRSSACSPARRRASSRCSRRSSA